MTKTTFNQKTKKRLKPVKTIRYRRLFSFDLAVPSEQLNKVGIKLIPKLRLAKGLNVEVVMTGNIDGAGAMNFIQAINDLGLRSKLNVRSE